MSTTIVQVYDLGQAHIKCAYKQGKVTKILIYKRSERKQIKHS